MTPDYVTMPQEGQVKVIAKRFSINKSLSLHLGMQARLLQQTDILSVQKQAQFSIQQQPSRNKRPQIL